MTIYQADKGRVSYGTPIGILCLEIYMPFIPGDVANATSYDFPVHYMEVEGATVDAVIHRQDPGLADAFLEAGRELVRQGCKAITSDCGYIGAYQQTLAEELPVPVFLSSLMQLPSILAMLGKSRTVGVMVASGGTLSDKVLEGLGITDLSRVVIQGLEHQPHFKAVIHDEQGWLDDELMEREVVETAVEMQKANPDMGAILMECSDVPPYGAAVQSATGLPVFDWIGFINYVHHAVVRTPYLGSY